MKKIKESESNRPPRGPDTRLVEAVRRREPEALGEFFEIYFNCKRTTCGQKMILCRQTPKRMSGIWL